MSEKNELESLIFRKTWHVPLSKKELFNGILVQLDKLLPPIIDKSNWFYQPAWNASNSDNYMDFKILPAYFYILNNIDRMKPQYQEYERLKAEFDKNVNKIMKNAPSFFSNGDPNTLHIDILETSDSGCLIEIECQPFLYYNITLFKTKIDSI